MLSLLARPPFVCRTEITLCRGELARGCAYAVAVPVRNEAERLPATLDALATAMRRVGPKGAAVFVVNDSHDCSAAIIEGWSRHTGLACLVIEASFAPDIRNAPHARRLALDIAALSVGEGALLTTDADTRVGPDWIRRGLAAIDGGADLVCEDVLLDDAELAALPPRVREVGDAERAYFEACDRLWRYWTYGRAGTLAIRPSGASMAIRAATYRSLGGLPTPVVGEDAALCERMIELGHKIEPIENIGTRTSARLVGRARGGCSAALADRASTTDPMCDARLMPLSQLHDEAMLWLDFDRADQLSRKPPARRCEPMRFSAVRRELARANRLLVANGLGHAA